MSALTEAEREVRRDDVDAVARILMDAWERAEGTRVGLSYIATHADMARALIASDWLAAREAAAREAMLAEVEALAERMLACVGCYDEAIQDCPRHGESAAGFYIPQAADEMFALARRLREGGPDCPGGAS